jgi:hypothetical protein
VPGSGDGVDERGVLPGTVPEGIVPFVGEDPGVLPVGLLVDTRSIPPRRLAPITRPTIARSNHLYPARDGVVEEPWLIAEFFVCGNAASFSP